MSKLKSKSKSKHIIRKFAGHYYVKIFESKNEQLAKTIHNRRHGLAKYSIFLATTTGRYQVWAKKGLKREVKERMKQ